MSTYYTASANYLDDPVLPMTPQRYLRSGLPSEYSSPYLSIPMMNYYNNITGSGGSSGCSNRTPLSPLVKVEEDVLVMDGVLVRSKSKSSSSSNSNSGGSLYKTELCKSWEETGYCRYGFHCQVSSFCYVYFVKKVSFSWSRFRSVEYMTRDDTLHISFFLVI